MPTSHRNRRSLELGRLVTGFVVLSIVTSSPTGTVRAQGSGSTATIPGPTAASIALAAAANYKTSQESKWKDYEDVVILNLLSGLAKAAANAGQQLTAVQYTSVSTEVRTFLNTKLPSNPVFPDQTACLRYAIDSLVSFNNPGSVSAFLPAVIGRLENLKFATLEAPLNASRQTPSDLATYSVAANALSFIAAQVQEASDLARSNAQLAAAVNPVLIDLMGFDTTASYAQLQSAYATAIPALPTPASDGSFTVTTQSLLTQYQSIIIDVAATADAHLASIESQASSFTAQSRLDARIQASATAAASTPCTAGTSTGGKIVISADDCSSNTGKPPDYWALSQSAVTAISKIAGYADPQIGTQISTVGGAVIQGAKAIAQIDGIVSAGSIFSSLAPALSLAGPVGALVGAGATIFSSFFGGGSSGNNQAATAAILQQIQKLNQQITRLQQDMTNRFNQVDAKLNTVLATLNSNFALINYQLGVLNGDARAIQAGLLDVQTQLNQLQQYTLAYSQAQSKATLISQMNGCLNYAAVHDGADIGQLQYNGCENNFYTWPHDNALDQLWAGLVQLSYGDSNIYSTFLNFPLSVNINYLAQFPSQNLGLPNALTNTRIANPNEWVLGARAYLQLGHEWRQYALQINSSRLDDLIQIGTNLQQAAQRANSSGIGPGIVPNQSLFTTLANKYTTTTGSLQTAIQGLVTTFTGDPTRKLQGLNLWGGSGQATSYSPSLPTQMPGCNDSSKSYSVPANLVSLLGSAPILAAQLGIGNVSLCLSLSSVPVMTTQNSDYLETYDIRGTINSTVVFERVIYMITQAWPYCTPLSSWNSETPACQLYLLTKNPITPVNPPNSSGSCYVSGYSSYGGPVPYSAQVQQLMSSGHYFCRDVGAVKDRFVNHSDLVDITAQTNTMRATIDGVFRSYQRDLYNQISAQFSSANQVQTAGQALSGAKLVMQAYLNFGLPTSLQNNNALRALLYGNQSIFDAAAIQADFAALGSSSIPDTTDNKITDEFAAISSRLTRFSSLITAALTLIQQNQRPDSLPEVDLMLEDLRAFQTLRNSGGLSFCTYQLSSSAGNLGGPGGTAVVTVNTANGCSLLPSSRSSWVQTSTVPLGFGQIQVFITAAPNTGGSVRSGVVIIGDQVYRLLQDTNPTTCTYSLSAQTVSVGRSASNGSVGVVAPVGCGWTASTDDPSWLTITSGSTGNGNGPVGYAVLANTTMTARTGNLFIAGQTFTVTQAGASSTPPAGAGSSQAFTFTYTDPAGYQDISGSQIIINSTLSAVGSCYVLFGRGSNAIALADDSGTPGPLTTLGAPTVLQNSQCSVLASLSSQSGSGNTLTLIVYVVFKPAFAGPKNVYTAFTTNSGVSSGLQQIDTFTVTVNPTPISAISVTPASGTGQAQVFTFNYSDPNGYPNTSGSQVLFNASTSSIGACYILFGRGTNLIALGDDTGSNFTTAPLGGQTVLQNSQCSVFAANSYQSGKGTDLFLTLFVAFKPAFAGAKNIYSGSTENGGNRSAFVPLGTWTVPATPPALAVNSVTPSAAAGPSNPLTFVFSDPNGFTDISGGQVIVNPTQSTGAGSCYIQFAKSGLIALAGDNGVSTTTANLGQPTFLQNSQCIVNAAASYEAGTGNYLNLSLFITMKTAGAKNVYASVSSIGGVTSGYSQVGTWNVTSPSALTPVSVSPGTGAGPVGTPQFFTFTYSDSNGASDISGSQIIINPALQGASSCYVLYGRGTNVIALANDNASSFTSGTLGTAGMLQNSQCSIDLSKSFQVQTGNTVNLTLAVTFSLTYRGLLYAFSNVVDNAGNASSFPALGAYLVQ